MITRIVKLTFRTEDVQHFVQIFTESATLIQSFDGCAGVQLMKDASNQNVYFTLSKWQSEDHLNTYRSSELFKTTWAQVKPMFSEKPEAWSLAETIPIL
ncbi:antibiotic biosynthesis monooxygenase family protein [Daejeonella sp.]|uniref:putative quinol monooxygenase n=1 Tax=Daejeonella sp. TaxID=2805397 RepID=UPI0030C39237